MTNKDSLLLNEIIDELNKYSISDSALPQSEIEQSLFPELKDKANLSYPFDKNIIESLKKIKPHDDRNDYEIFKSTKEINDIWKMLLSKSIICLRYFDKREPFIEKKTKTPTAYGILDISKYFDDYIKFESLLYGGGQYYRDHVIHVFRTWLLGMEILLRNNGEYLKKIELGENIQVNNLEKICIWTLISLTHDLGYPMEKSQEIIEKTRHMMKSFVSNPTVNMDISYSGIQCNMNDFILRFMSSKMIPANQTLQCSAPNIECKQSEIFDLDKCKDCSRNALKEKYTARLQPKYFFKFQKSLEQSKHGVVSAIIIYKLLTYFLESDYSTHEDYYFEKEDARQFYIRREILRSISSHTCKDIYHLDMFSFSYLLILADDCQEWGRKRLLELYVQEKRTYQFDQVEMIINADDNKSIAKESFIFPDGEILELMNLIKQLFKQYEGYKLIFRDGQDTAKRNFSFEKKCKIEYDLHPKVEISVDFTISKDAISEFIVKHKNTGTKKVDSKFKKDSFIEKIFKINEYDILDESKDGTFCYKITSKGYV